jgi:hypothetical protein
MSGQKGAPGLGRVERNRPIAGGVPPAGGRPPPPRALQQRAGLLEGTRGETSGCKECSKRMTQLHGCSARFRRYRPVCESGDSRRAQSGRRLRDCGQRTGGFRRKHRGSEATRELGYRERTSTFSRPPPPQRCRAWSGLPRGGPTGGWSRIVQDMLDVAPLYVLRGHEPFASGVKPLLDPAVGSAHGGGDVPGPQLRVRRFPRARFAIVQVGYGPQGVLD